MHTTDMKDDPLDLSLHQFRLLPVIQLFLYYSQHRESINYKFLNFHHETRYDCLDIPCVFWWTKDEGRRSLATMAYEKELLMVILVHFGIPPTITLWRVQHERMWETRYVQLVCMIHDICGIAPLSYRLPFAIIFQRFSAMTEKSLFSCRNLGPSVDQIPTFVILWSI